MVARRKLAFLASLLAAGFVAGCAQTVSGTATFAEGSGGGGGPTGTSSSSTASPGKSSSSSPSASPSSSSSSSGGGPQQVCEALDKTEVERLLGSPVTFDATDSTTCNVRGPARKSLIVAVFDYLTLSEYKRGQFKELQVGGHPAVRTTSNIIYVARSANPEAEGLLAAYFSALGAGGDTIASQLLQQLLKKYSK